MRRILDEARRHFSVFRGWGCDAGFDRSVASVLASAACSEAAEAGDWGRADLSYCDKKTTFSKPQLESLHVSRVNDISSWTTSKLT